MEAFINFFKPADKTVVGSVAPSGESDRLKESDEFFKKWAGPIIIGSFVPAIFAFITVVFGTMTIGAAHGQCGYPLSCYFIIFNYFNNLI